MWSEGKKEKGSSLVFSVLIPFQNKTKKKKKLPRVCSVGKDNPHHASTTRTQVAEQKPGETMQGPTFMLAKWSWWKQQKSARVQTTHTHTHTLFVHGQLAVTIAATIHQSLLPQKTTTPFQKQREGETHQ